MPARGRRGGSAGLAAACPRCRCWGWRWGHHTGPRQPRHSQPLLRCQWLPCLGCAARPCPWGTQGAQGPAALPVAARVPGAGEVPWGSVPIAVGRGGSVYPLLSSTHFLSAPLSLFSSSFKEQDHFPRPPPPAPAPPAQLRHMPVWWPPAQPDPGPAHPHLGGRAAVQPPPLGTTAAPRWLRAERWVAGDAHPEHLGPLGSFRRAPRAGGRGPVLRSPSWVTHSPRCGCEVPRQRLRRL